ncbi:hypothetical protein [Raineya orbicola]|jgi:hypothetical protein|uniref:Uncharacterized protein n=1 Tax=Raineya orbicola TaxID=2016530 RepID=A0A2N3IHY4_9BACT|nr:hypothetical protein [Raineya orbicola]PKQ69970.1 hypothetical protein Rain11_1035 [Raineya orbicola]
MKLIDTLLLSASVGFLIIGIYEIMMGRFAENYWVLMMMLISLFIYGYRKNLRVEKEKMQVTQKNSSQGKNKTKGSLKK